MSSIPSQTRNCPDCGGSLNEILAAAPGTAGLVYSEPSKAKGLWATMTEKRPYGIISALMCAGCHRIFLYGVPKD